MYAYRVWAIGVLTGVGAALCWTREFYWWMAVVLVLGLLLIPSESAEHLSNGSGDAGQQTEHT